MNVATRPVLAITLGDPAGIGAEVIIKALQHLEVFEQCRPLVIGDERILRRAAGWCQVQNLQVEAVESPADGQYRQGTVTLLDLHNADPAEVAPGKVAAPAGKAAVDYVLRACDLALAHEVEAVVTAPLNKEAMHLAGYTLSRPHRAVDRTDEGRAGQHASGGTRAARGPRQYACVAGRGDTESHGGACPGCDPVGSAILPRPWHRGTAHCRGRL